jgi:ABC-type uncharacterized transport system fused permease/ATPase subunit
LKSAALSSAKALRRFWRTARGFRHDPVSWTLITLLVCVTVLEVVVQYRLNYWNRNFFDALEVRNGHQIWLQARILLVLVFASISLAIGVVWCRMPFQRLWRNWLTGGLIGAWLADDFPRLAE